MQKSLRLDMLKRVKRHDFYANNCGEFNKLQALLSC